MEADMWKRLQVWLDRDLAVQRLAALDDRLLADMGLERENVRQRVMGRTSLPSAPADEASVGPCVSLQPRAPRVARQACSGAGCSGQGLVRGAG
jgi:uncharacterized protein YjiS (DUF1127 family)